MKKNRNRLTKPLLFLVGALAVVTLLMWPTNYYLESPGNTFAVDQLIKTKKKPKNLDELSIVTVSQTAQPARVFQYLWSFTDRFVTRVPKKELLDGQSSSQYQELQNWYMETSQQTAIYYAAKKAGRKTQLKYQGVYVLGLQKDSSFKNKLQIGDIIVEINSRKFNSIATLTNFVQHLKLGTKLKLKILRQNRTYTYQGKSVRVAGTKKSGIGIQLVERLKVESKPKIKITAADIGGPSAGLMFTLASYEIFTGHNLTKGHKVAGTGTIATNGKVGIIGGVDKKVVAASRAGAEIFFAPTDQEGVKKNATNYAVAQATACKIHTKMKIVPVSSFDSALSYLKKHY